MKAIDWLRGHPGWFAAFSVLLFCASTGLIALALLSKDLPSLQELERYRPMLSSRLYSEDGSQLGELFQQKRVQVPLDQVPSSLLEALLATEDRRFYEHWGIDVHRIFGALLADVVQGRFAQGASTLTQQLARDLYLSREKSILRKLREMLTAIQIERSYAKDEILEMYLTQAYFGHGAFGIQLAARRYFGCDVDSLTLPQSALLVGLLKAPANYTPFFKPKAAMQRRNTVLALMRTNGFISQEEYKAAIASPLGNIEYSNNETAFLAPYFSEHVRLELEELQGRLGIDIYRDGLEITTTLNLRMQELAEQETLPRMAALDSVSRASFLEHDWEDWHLMTDSTLTPEGIAELKQDSIYVEHLLSERIHVQPALVAVEPGSGAIRSMIGGRDFVESKYNRAVQARRQPGSAFKPFLYVAAIDNGYPPCYQVLNQDVVVEETDGRRWTPQNYDDSRSGMTTLREGLRKSYNLVSVRLLMEVVPPDLVAKYAHQMGISTPIETDYTMALGSSGVYPLELTSAYACLANGGIYYEPYSIQEIRDREGHLIYHHQPRSREVLGAGSAYIMTNMLQTVIDRGTGGSARWRYHFYAPAAGKTGTTNGFTDAWFVGFTPRLACAVWVGNDNPLYSLGEWQSGGKAALPIWASFMRDVYEELELPRDTFERPEEVVEIEVCGETYEPAGPLCPTREKEIFLRSYRPTGTCHLHRFDF